MRPAKEVVLVTGASGLIGSQVVNQLAQKFQVIGFDKRAPLHHTPGVDDVRVDLTSEISVKQSLESIRYRYGDWFAAVIHLAGQSDFSGEPNRVYEEVAVSGTDRLLRELQHFRVEQFVFSSSVLVYAPTQPGCPINEASPLLPKWIFPRSKIQTEWLIRERRGDMQTAFLRIAGVYDDECHSAPLAHQMQRIFERQMVSRVFPGEISHGQAFVHLSDLVTAIERVVECRWSLPPELTMILGEPETMSYEELQTALGWLIHHEEWQTKPIPKSTGKSGEWLDDQSVFGEQPFIKPWMIDLADDHYELDIQLARRLLDWEPEHSLRSTLSKMAAALKADPVRWYRENKLEAPAWLEEFARTSIERTPAS